MRVLAFVPSDAFLNAWGLYLLLVAVLIVPVVLVLLARLIATAMTINRHAASAAAAAAQMRANSEPAAQLAETLRVAGDQPFDEHERVCVQDVVLSAA